MALYTEETGGKALPSFRAGKCDALTDVPIVLLNLSGAHRGAGAGYRRTGAIRHENCVLAKWTERDVPFALRCFFVQT